MAQPPILELWDGLACEGGVRKERIDLWESGSYSDPIDPTSATFALAVPQDADWLRNADLQMGDVVRITDHLGRVTERLVSAILDGDGLDDGLVHIEGQHPIMRLARCGPIRSVNQGGAIWENLGLDNGTPRHFWDTYIEPTLLLEGFDWVQAGTWDWTDRYSIAWQSWKPLQLLLELRNRTKRAEIDFRRVGETHYEVDFLMRRGASAKVITLHPQRNLRTIRRELRLDRITTVIQPQGVTVNGGTEPETIRYAAYEVTDIQQDTPQVGRHTLTIDYPGNGTSQPIFWDDQFGGSGLPELPNRWALLPDASLVEIVDTIAATQALVVEGDIGSLSVGDHIEIRADSDGTHLTELANPSAVARWGRIHRTLQVSEARGERNMVRNPMGLADEDAVVVTCRKDGAVGGGGSTSVALKDLPPGLEIKEGDRLSRSVTTGLASFRVEADAVVDGSGNVTVTVHRASTWLDNEPVHIHRQAGTRQPTAWEYPATILQTQLIAHRDPSVFGQLTAEADGAQSFTPGTSLPHVKLRGLTPGDVVQYGDVVLNTPVMQGGVADGDGKLTVGLLAAPSVSLTDGQQVTISRPELLNDGGSRVIGLQFQGTPPLGLWTPPITIRHDDTLPVARAFVAIEYWNPTNSTRTLGAAVNTHGVQVRVRDVTGGGSTQLAVVADKDPRTIPAMSTVPVIFMIPFELSSTREVVIDITPPGPTSGEAGMIAANAVFVFLRWVMIVLSPDPDVPFTPASHGNVLVREGLATLLEESTEELVAGYEVEFRDLSASDDYVAADEEIVPGGDAHLYSNELGIDTVVRIVEAVYDLRHPEQSRIVLATDPRLLSRTLSRQRGAGSARVVVQVDVAPSVAGGLAGGGTGGSVSEDPDIRTVEVGGDAPGQVPVTQPGAPRAILPPGDFSLGGAVKVTPIKPGGSGEKIIPTPT